MVADALSRRSHAEIASILCREWEILDDLVEFDLKLIDDEGSAVLSAVVCSQCCYSRSLRLILRMMMLNRFWHRYLVRLGYQVGELVLIRVCAIGIDYLYLPVAGMR